MIIELYRIRCPDCGVKAEKVALALDEAQQPYGYSSAGFGALGIENLESETLPNSHRSTRKFVELAFFVLQHTTDLYSNEFPDYTTIGQGIISDDHPQAEPPQIIYCNEATSLGRFVAKRVSDMRRENIRQIAVICHADSYWSSIEDELRKNRDLPLNVLRQRGENLDSDTPMVVLSRPGTIGGQEFDAVILVGLEQGVVPPVLRESPTLAGALEQQAYREMYVSITRARYRVLAVISPNASPTLILREAEKAGRITSHLQ